MVTDKQSGNVISLAAIAYQKQAKTSPPALQNSVGQAQILVLANRFPFYASIEVNDLPWIRVQFSARSRDLVVASVKKILCQEFGRKRVLRTGYHFEIQHRNAELLISALMHVQFYTNQILLPEYNLLGERVEQNGVSITWGVGRTLHQAGQDRIRKRRSRLPGSF